MNGDVSFYVPGAVLFSAFVLKIPALRRDPGDVLQRSVAALLLAASLVFAVAAPSSIAAVNRWTGVPNAAAPLVYSTITAFSCSCIVLLINWQGTPLHRTRRACRYSIAAYAAVIIALNVLFVLADPTVERLRDLDTYYATTPFIREEILLYLVAHTAACLITYRLIRNWVRAESLDVWLRGGLKALGLGCALNLVFDAAKLTAVVARWAGHDLDWLSTHVAPPVAALAAICIAVGFILPHGGQYLQDRWRVRASHRRLRPLYLLTRSVDDSRVPFALRATPELRLTRRETFIRDALLRLTRHLDEDLRRRAYDAALDLGHEAGRAKALAAAVAIQDAVATRRNSPDSGPTVTLFSGPLVFPGRGTGGGAGEGRGEGAGWGPGEDSSWGPGPGPGPGSRSGSGPGSGADDPVGASGRTAFPEFRVSSDPTDLLQDIEAVSLVLREPAAIEAVRALSAASRAESGVPVRE